MGFEPTPPKRLVPKTSALDRSAIQPKIQGHRVWHTENGKVFGNARWKIKNRKPFATKNSPTGIRTRVVWVKTTYPDQLDYWGNGMRRPGIKPGSRPWQGRILSLYYRRANLSVPRLELGISRVLGERHDQLDHTDGLKKGRGVSGFRSQYLVLAKDARFRLRQYPLSNVHLQRI